MRPGLKLITLDVTDTLLRFRRPVFETYFDLAKTEFGLEVESREKLKISFVKAFKSVHKYRPNFGSGSTKGDIKHWWSLVVNQTFKNALPPKQYNESLVSALSERLFDHFSSAKAYSVYEDAISFVNSMHKDHPEVQLGVITNNDRRIVNVLDELGILPLLSVCVYSEDVGCSKPHISIFEKTLKRANLEQSNHALHVGDHVEKDYLAALNAGFRALWVNREGSRDDRVPAQHDCRDFGIVRERIEKLL